MILSVRPQRDLWQGYFGYWQNYFIHHHILLLGSAAWSGYVTQGRGMVICNIQDKILPSIDWNLDTVSFDLAFIAQGQAAKYLQPLELELEAVSSLLRAIATYDPWQAIITLIMGNGVVDINLLQHLKISPADCYQQVHHRWEEFYSAF